jgi:hypothetical protein
MSILVTQIVRTIMQYAWAFAGSLGLEQLFNKGEVEAWLTAIITAVLIAVLSWLERKLPWVGKLFVFDKTPSY